MNKAISSTTAVILAGGRGTRLSSLHPSIPKALVPIAGKPFLRWQLEWLAGRGLRAVHMATGHMSDAIEDWLASNPVPGISISSSREPSPLGTAGGMKFAGSFVSGDTLFVLNGDSLLPALDFESMLRSHLVSAPMATISVTRIESAGRYGTVEFDADGSIKAFLEKADRRGGWVNGGVYLVSREMLNGVEPGANVSMETDVFPRLAAEGVLRAFKSKPPLIDMGTPEGIRVMESFLTGS